ncbi:DNA polymerase delta subunit 2 [Saccharata proteae CBS 121410]|uniref:DNA polymerase delta subunit 2 n=1 Tax=Saccharata proteae CBS 121410 TaxID=1314787 RepID=A0A9P4HWQ4_9PEZI|nr:DNA polymerase delta subunit 2 [Saccharata proteae CBS 121410]
MSMADDAQELLQKPATSDDFPTQTRAFSSYAPLQTFVLPKGEDRHYAQQYADMYFMRLAELKPEVEKIAAEAWEGFEIGGEKARRVDRVLDVRQGELCWVVGTVYMEMPLKPNILDDISKDHWISAPPPREKYISPNGEDQIMLEDESGRLRLTGSFLATQMLVTGCIIAAMGTENSDGVFEVAKIQVADLAPQPDRLEQPEAAEDDEQQPKPSSKVAIISGLRISGSPSDALRLSLLTEYLTGELGSPSSTQTASARISRLIIAGDSLANASPIPSREDTLAAKKSSKKFGYDASIYNPAPTEHLDQFLSSLLPTLPITLMPGASDPANVAIPQQPLHPALFPLSRAYANPPGAQHDPTTQPGWFDSSTNPFSATIAGYRYLGSGGQPVSDIYKYVPSSDRLEMMESMLRWRCNAPTAPDTLWSYPFQDEDPLLIKECPHVFFAGNMPEFGTDVVEGYHGQTVRVVAVPGFRETGQVVLVDEETLEVEVVEVGVFGDADGLGGE